MLDPIASRVVARHLLAKATSLTPEFTMALHAFRAGNIEPMMVLIKRVIDLIMPGGTGHPPSWYYALGPAKKNALNFLQKEGHVLLMELPSLGQDLANPTAPGSRFEKFPEAVEYAAKFREHFAKRLEEWGKKLRTLEIASQADDEEKHIKHGPFTVIRIAGLTQTDVNGALEALDAAADKIRGRFPQVLYGTIHLSPHLGSKRAASYVWSNDTIQLDVHARKRFSDMQTLVHEFGHRFDHKFFHNKELRERFWKLSTEKVMETVRYDEKLRRAVAEEALQFAKARKAGGQMPAMSADLERWIKSPMGVGPYIKTVMTNYLTGKFDERKVIAEVMGPMDRDVETGNVLHAPLHVTPYGGTKPTENFAEAFAFYVLGLAMPPELAEIMVQL